MCLRCGAAEEQESAVAAGSEHGIALQGRRVPVVVTRDPLRADAPVRKTPSRALLERRLVRRCFPYGKWQGIEAKGRVPVACG